MKFLYTFIYYQKLHNYKLKKKISLKNLFNLYYFFLWKKCCIIEKSEYNADYHIKERWNLVIPFVVVRDSNIEEVITFKIHSGRILILEVKSTCKSFFFFNRFVQINNLKQDLYYSQLQNIILR